MNKNPTSNHSNDLFLPISTHNALVAYLSNIRYWQFTRAMPRSSCLLIKYSARVSSQF